MKSYRRGLSSPRAPAQKKYFSVVERELLAVAGHFSVGHFVL
jgi:hypothetical protein